MGITFAPKGFIQQTQECGCMVVYRLEQHLMDDHDDCPGFKPVGEIVPELDVCHGNAEKAPSS